MNKKGFTLLELLAVVVVLAIIALIAVPIILNTIDKSKQGAAESSALGYIDAVEKQVMVNKVKSSDAINSGEYTKVELNAKGVKVKGKIDDALLTINTKGKVSSGKFCINGYSIDYDGKKAKVNKRADYCSNIRTYNASEVAYSNALSKKNCQTVECALNELYDEVK